MEKESQVYIVAGDEMQRMMKNRYPDYETIPFREDFSKGHVDGFLINRDFIEERAAFWGVTQVEYRDKFAPIIDLDLARQYVLCFGEDDCCQANLKFMVGYLRSRGYDRPIQIRIINEYDLTVLEEYQLDITEDRC